MDKFQILKKYFGYDCFRGGQEQVIDQILSNRDCLAIMPTGAGKSICFYTPALSFEGITLVICPLISLMHDQVMSLISSGVPSAYINSSLNSKQIFNALENAKNYKYKIIYVAPERLLTPDFLNFAKNVNISMISIDEAHCISQWGQDFRPSYTKIPEFINMLQKRPVVCAFTATATHNVKNDILNLLELKNPYTLVTGFNRENLFFDVRSPSNKFEFLQKFLLNQKNKSGIIYCISRKNVETVCQNLCDLGFNATRYHAGLSDFERKQNQDNFLFDKVDIMVATNAFGMGIDKSNVSFVVHYNMPKDIESYYQEAGRAGRDGSFAECLLLYSANDVRTQKFLIENSRENSNFDEETLSFIIEQEFARLKQMTFFSTTNDCLRAFILKYFGETPDNFCGNCFNCNTNFEIVDITQDAKLILLAILQLDQRFGTVLVCDVLRGSLNERVKKFNFQSLDCFGSLKKSVKYIVSVINYLILNNYLEKSDDEYPVLKISNNNLPQTLTMKMAKEKDVVSKIKSTANTTLSSEQEQIFDALRIIRKQLANLKGVPAFTIFSDKTLVEMCINMPTTRQDFLAINGVGQQKLEQFGDAFINELKKHSQK